MIDGIYDRIEESEALFKKIKPQLEKVKKVIAKEGNVGAQRAINSDDAILEHLNRAKKVHPGLDTFERIIGPNNLLEINYLRMALKRSKSVARVVVKNKLGGIQGYGSGFMVSPRLFMTNNHVIDNIATAKLSEIEFDFEINVLGKVKKVKRFQTAPELFFVTSPSSKLDYTIVALEELSSDNEPLSDFGYIPLIEQTGKILKGHYMSIIQHPDQLPKQITIRDNTLLEILPEKLIYMADTQGGSSGSPVFNDSWEVVALHHSGVPAKDEHGNILNLEGNKWEEWMGEHKVKWMGNEGIRISVIIKDLKSRKLKPEAELLREQMLSAVDKAVLSEEKEDSAANNLNPAVMSTSAKQYTFEVLLNDNKALQKMASKEIRTAFGGSLKPLFPGLNNHPENQALRRFYKVEILTDENPWDIARKIKKMEGVEDVDPVLTTNGIEDPGQEMQLFESASKPNKSNIEKKHKGITPTWNHKATNFPNAEKYTRSKGNLKRKTTIRIAQIDTGFSDHPEIGLVNKTDGYDYVSMDGDSRDDMVSGFMKQPGHGTRTAGVLMGTATKTEGDLNNGVFPYVHFVPFRVANSVIIIGTSSNMINAVLKAVKDDFDIITMSMGSYGRSSWRALAKYVYDHGVIWCCAAGNEVRKFFMVVRPAKYPGTIAVAATNYKDKGWSRSSRGKAVDIAAPGENVYVATEYDGGVYGYNYGSGTSYATPHIAAAAAMWLNHHKKEIKKLYKQPWQKVEAFRTLLQSTARKPSGWKNNLGAGILNAETLLKAKLPDPKSLKYAYGSIGVNAFESTKETISVTEKELIHHLWNQDQKIKDVQLESLHQVSDLTKTTKRVLDATDKSSEQLLKDLDHKF